jgi:hypothetical protein
LAVEEVEVDRFRGESDQMVGQVVDTGTILIIQRERLVHLVKEMVVGEPVDPVWVAVVVVVVLAEQVKTGVDPFRTVLLHIHHMVETEELVYNQV